MLLPISSEPSFGLTLSEPMYGGSPSGSTHATRGAVSAPALSLEPPQPGQHEAEQEHDGRGFHAAARASTRTIVRASVTSSATATRSSTAWASSSPFVPTIVHGMPRAVKWRMSAP